MMRVFPSPYFIFGILFLVQVLFGINYIVSKILVSAFPPLVWASVRCIATAILLGIVVDVRGIPHPKGRWLFFGPLLAFGLLGVVINQSCFLVGLKYTTPTNAAILNTLIPVFTLLIVMLRGEERMSWKKGVGFTSALVGVLILLKVENFHISDRTFWGDLLNVVNSLSYGIYLGLGKRFLETHDRVWITFYTFVCGAFFITLLALPDYLHFDWPRMSLALWGGTVYAIVAGTFLTYLLVNWVLAYTEASRVALFVYVQPVVASLMAWWWLDEKLTSRTFVGSLFIFTGVYLATRKVRELVAQAAATPAVAAASAK